MNTVPEQYRNAIRMILDELVAGALPDKLLWVREYGSEGAVLISQPDEIWTHKETYVLPGADGSLDIDLPLWTTTESPSDLTAQFVVEVDGSVQLYDVHVM